MWSYCLWGLLGVLELRPTNASDILTLTLNSFEKALSEKLLTEDLFKVLMELLASLDQHEDTDRVSALGVEHHPTSPTLWLARLSLMAERNAATSDILGTLRTALRKVSAQASWSVWQFGLNLLASRDQAALEELMEEACRCSTQEVCKPAKEWSLTWTFRQGGIKKARNVYRSLKSMRPITVDFYRCYILMEASQMEPNFSLIRGAFEECLIQFGNTNTDVWLNYMEMEKTVAKDAPRSGQLQQRALHALNPDMKESFLRLLTMTGVEA